MSLAILSKANFESLRLTISSDVHPSTQQGLQRNYAAADFLPLAKGEQLFKAAARMKINVLCEERHLSQGVKDS